MAVLTNTLEELHIPEDDAEAWITSELGKWKIDGKASPDLEQVIESVLQESADDIDWKISAYYFGLHGKLMSAPYAIGWAEARELLSHVRLIADLALHHRMTAGRIARVLAQASDQAPRYSRALDPVLKALGSPRKLDADKVISLLEEDRIRAVSLFGDSNFEEVARDLDSRAQLLGVEAGLEPLILALADDTEPPFGPYLQILHFLLISTEYFDHFLRDAYEFSPRGSVAKLVFEGHPGALKAGNPFLNNAKKVRVLNEVWAEGADGNLTAARALATLLETLDALAYPARRELASLIRAWIAKVFDAFADSMIELPEHFRPEQFMPLIGSVASLQSRTGGIVEQRLVDLFCVVSHPRPRWIHVGIGDSVNTTNVSRRKCGDAEAIDSTTPAIVAYESHGGVMGAKYVAEHVRTLGRVLAARESDLLTRAQAADWAIKVVFIAHSITADVPLHADFEGDWHVSFEYLTFDQLRIFITASASADVVAGQFSIHCLPALRSQRTPNRVRERVLELAAAG